MMGFSFVYLCFILRFLSHSILADKVNNDKSYDKVLLTSMDGNLSVSVFLPSSAREEDGEVSLFYESTRFEHGSMIGDVAYFSHKLYGTDLWRPPHNPWNVESGVGLASEFGFGENGAYCEGITCAWKNKENVDRGGKFIINGVLGYDEALPGESFLKIGVGSLIKGSCQGCNGTEDYQFNNPYKFAQNHPTNEKWTFQQKSKNSITMIQKAFLQSPKSSKIYGYQLEKDISLQGRSLEVTSTLANLGTDNFHTPWYSHHFFTCDSKPVGIGYKVDILKFEDSKTNIRRKIEEQEPFYEEPGVGSWSTPIADYSTISSDDHAINITMSKSVQKGTKIKASFMQNSSVNGNIVLHGCQSKINEDLIYSSPAVSMYAMSIYIEDGTISPETLLLISVTAGQSISWKQRLQFNSYNSDIVDSTVKNDESKSHIWLVIIMLLVIGSFYFLWHSKKSEYSPVP